MRTWTPWLIIGLATAALVHGCVIDTVDDCYDDGSCVGPGGSGAMGGGVTTSDGGSGGGAAGGGAAGGMAECMDHVDCTMADEAQCDSGTCVPCTDDEHCDGVDGLGACNEEGECVECALDKESACDNATQTCNLLSYECVDVPPDDLATCEPCSNDAQCLNGACVPLDFQGQPHGHYCLAEFAASCSRPLTVQIPKTSLNQTTATFCALDEQATTCEAVLAIGWSCDSGVDGMCTPPARNQEVLVPGATCEIVNGVADTCTYPCTNILECPSTAPGNSCGDGMGATTGWCGG